jgi:hypothetical protein
MAALRGGGGSNREKLSRKEFLKVVGNNSTDQISDLWVAK